MELLLDTHTFIWFIDGDTKIPDYTKKLIINTSNHCYLSIASLWEIAIKKSLNRIELKGPFSKIPDFLIKNDIQLLLVNFEHIQNLLKLKYHHRDPFDRIIIAQGLFENFTILTKDEIFKEYTSNIIWNK